MKKETQLFEFTSYKFEPLRKRVIFKYKTEFSDRKPIFFTETIILPKIPNTDHVPKEVIKKLLESLHIILGISYYKLYCATEVALPYQLSGKEADFWNTIYKKGLGEFFYKNNLDPKISPKFPHKPNRNAKPYTLNAKSLRCLVGVGGGKDSIVSAELLKENNFNITAFFVQTSKKSALVENVIQKIGVGDLAIERHLDWQVYQRHKYGGHIPISVIFAFLGVLSCVLYGYKYFIVGNEYSSNFGNIKYGGLDINHQWSKSLEFERLFQEYVREFITPDVSYFSLLRPFYEIRIARMFSKHKKYFLYFSSCNSNFKIDNKMGNNKLWCGVCAKCAFVFTMLSPFIQKRDLLKIFGKNLYQDKYLFPLFKDVLGLGKMKPFDCVGTFKEAQSAMYLAKKSFRDDFIVKEMSKKIKFYPEVFKTQKGSLVPEQFKFLGMENALILGYGKEGKVTERYLRKYYPKIKLGVADQKQGNNYLERQLNFDIAIKTPGIKRVLVKIPYTTATNIFFTKVKGNNTIIGVTGSKGKSTTSSLIYEIIKEAGKNVELLGNIGHPMLECLLKPVKKDKVFVLELSSYQLDDVKFSPDIAILTSLFPEHMDYHGNVKKYFEAKKNIINFQESGETFVYNPESKVARRWLEGYNGKAIPFDKKVKFKTKLLGNHNKENIKAAISVAKIMEIAQKAMLKAVKNFKGLPHRLEFIGEYRGIKFYDDAISTTPESTIMAIKSVKNIGTIFLGGEDRGYDFLNLEKTIKKYKIKNVVLFPDSGKKMLKKQSGFNILKTSKMSEAVEFAYKNTEKGGVCLLSCASPSYSLWKDFNEKGDQFKHYVKKFSTQ